MSKLPCLFLAVLAVMAANGCGPSTGTAQLERITDESVIQREVEKARASSKAQVEAYLRDNSRWRG